MVVVVGQPVPVYFELNLPVPVPLWKVRPPEEFRVSMSPRPSGPSGLVKSWRTAAPRVRKPSPVATVVAVHDRDHNAAKNVKTAAGLAVTACGAR
ncbi:hypothetical protein [Streptomyces sp. NBC_00203]|uniref:hypothetical protein n=1 Tax=Streptomyces sp. NBC_00203 TaxID=2975680 RepID=UPI0032438E99